MKVGLNRSFNQRKIQVYFWDHGTAGRTHIAKPNQHIVFEEVDDACFAPNKGPTWELETESLVDLYLSLGDELRRYGMMPQIPAEAELAALRERVAYQAGLLDKTISLLGAAADRNLYLTTQPNLQGT